MVVGKDDGLKGGKCGEKGGDGGDDEAAWNIHAKIKACEVGHSGCNVLKVSCFTHHIPVQTYLLLFKRYLNYKMLHLVMHENEAHLQVVRVSSNPFQCSEVGEDIEL